MLDVLDKLGSVSSAVLALIGIVLTVVGLRRGRHHQTAMPAQPEAPTHSWAIDPALGKALGTRPTAEPPKKSESELIVPDRAEWVPESNHLPQPPIEDFGGDMTRYVPPPKPPLQPMYHPPTPSEPPTFATHPFLVPIGLALLGIGIVLGVISVLL